MLRRTRRVLLVIVFIIIFIGVYIFANLSPKDNTESQSLLHDKEDPSLTDNKEDPSLTDNKEDPSLTDNKESLSLTVLTDDKKAPFLTDDKEPPSLANDKEPPSLAKDKEPPSLANDKEPPSLAKDKEPPSLANDKETQLLPKYDIMPLAKYLKSREEFQNTEWVSVLYNYLKHLESPHVNMVFGDSKHMRLLENWITASMMTLKPPLDNVMVLSLDHLLCDQLMSTKFDVACIAAPIESFIVAYPEEVDKKWCAAMMVRQVVLRLINYWGYDVASYDSDAVLLRNPQVLYDAKPHVDVFSGSTKNFPGMVSKKWGFNLSCGVLILRATPAVEALWQNISGQKIYYDWDDQIALNVAVRNMGVIWNKTTDVKQFCSITSAWESKGILNVYVFPQREMCRYCCSPSTTLYVAHPHGTHGSIGTKEGLLRGMKAWFL